MANINSDQHLNYVMTVGTNYKPRVFGSNRLLNKFLQQKTLVNQTDRVLRACEIETLALGLNFITNADPPSEETDEADAHLNRYTKNVNWSLVYSNRDNNDSLKSTVPPMIPDSTATNHTPPFELRSQNLPHLRGHLSGHVPSIAQPSTQTWETDPSVLAHIDEYLKSLNPKSAARTPKEILMSVESLRKTSDVLIGPADKGGAVVLWKLCEYQKEALRQLKDAKSYVELSQGELTVRIEQLTLARDAEANELFFNKHITARERDGILSGPSKASPIYYLPKIHKPIDPVTGTFKGRPIVATYDSTVHLLDKYLTEITAPLLARIPGSLRDTMDLLNRLPRHNLPDGTRVMTVDVDALYPSIPWKEGVAACAAFYEEQLPWLRIHFRRLERKAPPTATTFKRLLSLILENSLIHYREDRYFHQILGTAMGCCISVFFANTYMYAITRKVLEKPPPFLSLFLRYIDDIIVLTSGSDDENCRLFQSISNEHIKYTMSSADTKGEFLDIQLIINPETSLIVTEPYSKPSATPFYLHAKSMHSKHTIESIPYAQFLRLKRNCSEEETFEKHAVKMTRAFVLRGYRNSTLSRALDRARGVPRNLLLVPKAERIAKTCAEADMITTPASSTAHASIHNLPAQHPDVATKNDARFQQSFKLIRTFNHDHIWPKVKRDIQSLHGSIQKHYENVPKKSKVMNDRRSALVFSNRPSIQSRFSKKTKKVYLEDLSLAVPGSLSLQTATASI